MTSNRYPTTRHVIAAQTLNLSGGIQNEVSGDVIVFNHDPKLMFYWPVNNPSRPIKREPYLYHLNTEVEQSEDGAGTKRVVRVNTGSSVNNYFRINFINGAFDSMRWNGQVVPWLPLAAEALQEIQSDLACSKLIALSRPNDHRPELAVVAPAGYGWGESALIVTQPVSGTGRARAFLVPNDDKKPTKELRITHDASTRPRIKARNKSDSAWTYPLPGRIMSFDNKIILHWHVVDSQEAYTIDNRKAEPLEHLALMDLMAKGRIPTVPSSPTQDIVPRLQKPKFSGRYSEEAPHI